MAVLITGASSGFGATVSRLFVENGVQVVGAARRAGRLREMEKHGNGLFVPLELDVGSQESTDAALAELAAADITVDTLINNAGLALEQVPAYEADMADWEMMVQTNVLGLIRLTRNVLPDMVRRNRGYIINMGSTAGSWPYRGGNVYGATKAFVRQFSLNLRTDLAGTRIRVTNLEPGLCGGTEFSVIRFKGDEEKAQALYRNSEPILPEDIAATVWWLYNTPAHMNVNTMEIMPVSQTYGGLAVSDLHKPSGS